MEFQMRHDGRKTRMKTKMAVPVDEYFGLKFKVEKTSLRLEMMPTQIKSINKSRRSRCFAMASGRWLEISDFSPLSLELEGWRLCPSSPA
jgi:hypothetical protein